MDKLKYNIIEDFLQSLIDLRAAFNKQIESYPLDDKLKFKKRSEIYKSVKYLILELMRDIDSPDFVDIRTALIESEMKSILRYFDEVSLSQNVGHAAKRVEDSYRKLRDYA